VLAGAVASLCLAVLADPVWGAFGLGACLLLGAVFRLPGGGLLALRSKPTDVITLTTLGLGLIVVALFIKVPALKALVLDIFG
jgi:hypothetical protein